MHYFWLALKHKWFVLVAGRELKVPWWRLIIHDWTKFLPWELPHYQRQFFGDKGDPKGFIRCWLHHQNSNDHHWEYWIPRTGHNRCMPPYPDNRPIPMTYHALKEMIADWMGASRAYTGTWPTDAQWPWLEENLLKILPRLHPESRAVLIQELDRACLLSFAPWQLAQELCARLDREERSNGK